MTRFYFNPEALQRNPCVYKVDRLSLVLTYEFRKEMYFTWKQEQQSPSVIAELLNKKGLTADLVGKDYPLELARSFKGSGFPRPHRSEIALMIDYKEEHPLILSGKYEPAGPGNGMRVTKEFMMEITSRYPEISVEESMRMAGIDPVDAGYQRIQKIKTELKKVENRLYRQQMEKMMRGEDPNADDTTMPDKEDGKHEDANKPIREIAAVENPIEKNPYVSSVSYSGVLMQEAFYNEAYLLYPMGIDKILNIYEIDPEKISERSKASIGTKLYHWKVTDAVMREDTMQYCRIQKARMQAMNQLIADKFGEIGRTLSGNDIEKTRKICRMIDQIPYDPAGFYTKKKILELAGISKSRYYALLNDETYGNGRVRRREDEEHDLELIRQVLDYRGFAKGIRQVYMLMPQVAGCQLSIHRIRKLMQKNGIRTTIRRPSKNRKAMKELIERNRKSNLLLRRFRLHRPNEVRLTDVTYLDYGNEKRAYGSASIDPATGRIICFIVRENNDLQLALDTLEAMDSHPAGRGAILHSDQGILYLTDEFQAAVLERELNQSMSRRGNCWDNCPQEAFFGHFKDESGYEKCQTLEELQAKVSEYALYYNEERKIWERGKKTPVEYEAWLEGMSEEEFSDYLAQEEERYRKMKELSAEKAIKSARERREDTLAALEEIDEACRSQQKV
ncbi:MAG: IS3 family transposase [Lachnospiraceae bacterium]|nr:IS3 family transposase [Lachnospiraceae bacterium]